MCLSTGVPLHIGRPLGKALALAAVWAAGAAQAAGPWSVGLTQALSHESNVFRAVDDNAVSDTMATTGVQLQLDQPFGRQRVTAELALEMQRFVNNSQWNDSPYRLGGELLWSAAERWEGEIGLDSSEESYRYDQTTVIALRNQIRTSRGWLHIRKGVVTDWTFESALNVLDRDLSLASFDGSDQRQWAAEAGARFQPSPNLMMRALLRHTSGNYPHRTALQADRYDRNDLELSANWKPSGASTLEARISFGSESHSLQSVRATSLWTGALAWRWQPTGKLGFSTSLLRDSDTGTSRFQTAGTGTGSGTNTGGGAGTGTEVTTAQSSDAKMSTTLALTATWAATAKIDVDVGWRYTQRLLDSSRNGTAGVQGNDDTTALTLGARYAPIRNLDLGCSLALERRSVSNNALTLSFPYSGNTLGCFGQFWFSRL